MPEHTIAENLTRLQNAKTAIGNAITAKGGTVASGDGLEEYAADIATIPSGGTVSAERKDVNFYDYDGSIVYSYTADEFAELTALPANPTHTGLTSQGWNWSLADAKEYVADYGMLDIGQAYITSDGKTRLYITLTEGRISPIFQLYLNANSELDIDWGDGTTHSTFTSTSAGYQSERHNYATAGDYVIDITVTTGSFILQSSSAGVSSILWNGNNSGSSPDRAYNNSIQKIEIGTGVSSIGNSAFNSCYSLTSITIPNSVISIGNNVFQNCTSLSFITIPDFVTSIGTTSFYSCTSLSFIIIPDSVASIGTQPFRGCYSLTSITIPDSVTSIGSMNFAVCYSLSFITIPDSVTSIGAQAFDSCTSLSSIKFTPTTPPSIANVNAWTVVPSDCYILVPYDTLDDYLNETNMPDDSVYLYLCFAKYASGVSLPTTDSDGYSLTWYATKDDARNGTNPITVGNGKEIYAVGV